MDFQLGENLSNYPNLTFFTGNSPQELQAQLLQIRHPHRILAIYAQAGNHVAWVSLSRPIEKRIKITEAQPIDTPVRGRGRPAKSRKE